MGGKQGSRETIDDLRQRGPRRKPPRAPAMTDIVRDLARFLQPGDDRTEFPRLARVFYGRAPPAPGRAGCPRLARDCIRHDRAVTVSVHVTLVSQYSIETYR